MPPEVGLTRHRGPEATPEGDKCDGAPVPAPAKERCPRCDSRDTKFCYYNNYNTSQPRHFCKSCRRYWTLGGSLRNVPIGGASRKRFRRSTTETVAGGRTGVASATPARVASRLSSPAPPRGYDPHHTQPLGLGEPSSLARTEYRLKLGLGLGCGSGLLPPVEEMEFGLAPTLLWPVGLGDTWPVGPDGGGCFAARPLAGSTAVSPVSAPAGVTGPAAAAAATGEFLRWSCE